MDQIGFLKLISISLDEYLLRRGLGGFPLQFYVLIVLLRIFVAANDRNPIWAIINKERVYWITFPNVSRTWVKQAWGISGIKDLNAIKTLCYFSFWISAVFLLNYGFAFFTQWGRGHCWQILDPHVHGIREESSSCPILGQQKSQERILIGLVWVTRPFLHHSCGQGCRYYYYPNWFACPLLEPMARAVGSLKNLAVTIQKQCLGWGRRNCSLNRKRNREKYWLWHSHWGNH